MQSKSENFKMVRKLGVIVLGMFCFGYVLVPVYKAICQMTGINILALGERQIPGATTSLPANTQVDRSRTITVEFDANARGPWHFKPAQTSLQVHPGELTTVMYEFQNVQNRTMSAQAIPSYAPAQAGAYFNKIQCFCFTEQVLQPGQSVDMPVAFFVDPAMNDDPNMEDVTTITLSYTFFRAKDSDAVLAQQQAAQQGNDQKAAPKTTATN